MPHFIYFVQPARPDFTPDTATEAEKAVIGEHFFYLKDNFEGGRVVFVDRTDSDPFTGLCVFSAADDAEANAFTAADPAVREGVFTGRAQPFMLVFNSGAT